jgi:hypothetical protein
MTVTNVVSRIIREGEGWILIHLAARGHMRLFNATQYAFRLPDYFLDRKRWEEWRQLKRYARAIANDGAFIESLRQADHDFKAGHTVSLQEVVDNWDDGDD